MPSIQPIAPYPMPGADDLPATVPAWRPSPRRAVLLIHDMQRFFLRPYADGRSPRRELVGNVAALRDGCAAAGVPVAYTAQNGGMTASQRGLLADFWGPGMRTDPDDQHVIDELRPGPGDWRFAKWRYSAFVRSALLATMRAHDRDQLIVCGVYAGVGVLMTAVEAFSNDIETFVVADAVADFSARRHRQALDYAAANCAVVLPTERLLAALRAERAAAAGRAGRPR
ncbi:isochorismatase family protein [Actinoplanes sp. NPDC051411]|uniref:isochorismatase family protein n=1 Tax=Actinoplanes sp. NPDC051411 TaxID=3155522 RepID=UPI00343EDD5F